MRTLLKRAAVVATATGAIIAATATPALAVRGDACGPGACGSATWSWASGTRITSISSNVKDTACDANDVYVQLRLYFRASGEIQSVFRQRRVNGAGCYASLTWNGLSQSLAQPILGVRVEVCVNDFGSDTCYVSGYRANPYA